MGLEINAISNVKLQKMARNVDDGDNLLNQEEISELLVKMAKRKYGTEDMNEVLGLATNNLNQEEKTDFYEKCLANLETSMKFSEFVQNKGTPPNTKVGAGALFGTTIGGLVSIMARMIILDPAMSTKKYIISLAKSGLKGGLTGAALLTLTAVVNKFVTKEQQARLCTKQNYIDGIQQELDNSVKS